eukprot:722205-Prymnesium_polylepis.1
MQVMQTDVSAARNVSAVVSSIIHKIDPIHTPRNDQSMPLAFLPMPPAVRQFAHRDGGQFRVASDLRSDWSAALPQ